MAKFRINALGGLEIAGPDEKSLTRKAKAVAIYLALQAAQPQPRDKIAALFWENSPQDQARTNLRQCLSTLRKYFGDSLITENDTVNLELSAVDADFERFEELIGRQDQDALETAVGIYKGDLLDGFGLKGEAFEAWIRAERERYRNLMVDGLIRLVGQCEAANATGPTAKFAAHLLALDPLNENVHRTLMRAYAEQRRYDAALKQFEVCKDVLLRELGVEPAAETRALYDDLKSERKLKTAGEPGTARSTASEPITLDAAPPAGEPLRLPAGPSIAVLPFINMSDDSEQEFLSDGITEDIITSLSKFPELFVVASSSTFTYKGQTVDVRRVGRDQGVRYVLEGSVRRAGHYLRITSQLIDAASGNNLWSERYDRNLDDIFALQDDITREVASAVQVRLVAGDGSYVRGAGTKSFEAWELTLKGGRLVENHTREDMQTAQELLERAVELDPNYVNAWVCLGFVHCVRAHFGWCASSDDALQMAWDMAERALVIEPGFSLAYDLFANIAMRRGDHADAVHFAEKSLLQAGNNPYPYANASFVLSYCGRPAEAIGLIERAMRLCPIYPNYYRLGLGIACYLAADLDRAVTTLREWHAHASQPEEPVLLAVALYDNGRREEAQVLVHDAIEAGLLCAGGNWTSKHPFSNPEILAHIASVLEELGVPKQG